MNADIKLRTLRCCPQIFLSHRISWNRFVAEEKSRSYISWTLPLLHTLHIYFFISLSSQSASSRSGQKPTTHFTRQL
ncbi:unnamed protein product, partial [Musa textilis]